MIKTKDGVTRAEGTKADLLTDFTGTAESLMRGAPITAAELIKAVKLAEATVEIVELLDKFGEEIDEDEESITVIPEEEESKAEEESAEPAQAEEKTTAKKGAVKATVLEADDLNGMLEWLKGELEKQEDELDD